MITPRLSTKRRAVSAII